MNRLLAMIALAGVCAAIPSCRKLPSHWVFVDADLNQEKWRAARITSYEYTLRRECSCDVTPLRITVTDNRVSAVANADDGRELDPATYRAETIDELFDMASTIADSAEFDPELGFPTHIQSSGTSFGSDEAFTIDVTDFRRL